MAASQDQQELIGLFAGNAPPKPSALAVAVLRAAHQLLDAPLVFEDPLALTILGPDEQAALRADLAQFAHPLWVALRASLAVRSRLAEDEWARAQQRGVRQYVILGAGLDTCAYRPGLGPGAGAGADVRLFEVDLPATQQWKRDCLRVAGIAEPANLRYVPVDFGRASLAAQLAAAGFRHDQPAFFSWLGVTVYLKQEDVMATLRLIAAGAPGSGVVFDYGVTPGLLEPVQRAARQFIADQTAARGEPWQSHFDPDALSASLQGLGFGVVDNYTPAQIAQRYLAGRSDGLRVGGVTRLIAAVV